MGQKRTRTVLTPEQKFSKLQDIEACPTVKEELGTVGLWVIQTIPVYPADVKGERRVSP